MIKNLRGTFANYLRNESGATAIEYGLIAALVALGMLVGLKMLADGQESSWGQTSTVVIDNFSSP
ncbi:MAG: Flp family type IVb pilin [Maricaulaceae bacterium]